MYKKKRRNILEEFNDHHSMEIVQPDATNKLRNNRAFKPNSFNSYNKTN